MRERLEESEAAIFRGNSKRPGSCSSLGLEVKKLWEPEHSPQQPLGPAVHTLSALKGGLPLPLNVSNSGAELLSARDYLLKTTSQCFMQVCIKRK